MALLFGAARLSAQVPEAPQPATVFARDNLVAWCIVPFDARKRGPAERAAMLQRLGIRKVAYDWRAQHVPTFEAEILEYGKHGLEYFAFWDTHEAALRLFEKHGLHPQIWKTLGSPAAATGRARVEAAAQQLLPLVARTKALGCKLGLYNHGGWGGEPRNLVAVCEHLRAEHGADHVGIVYNLHHGHGHITDFPEVLARMRPYLLCLNLNGMTSRGDKILPLGEGEHDVALLRTIAASGYRGPIGILGHTQDDVEERLRDNLAGLDWILPQLDGAAPGPRPALRTFTRGATPDEAAAAARDLAPVPATFEVDRRPLDPAAHPAWQHRVNRDRVYDFYAKQADHFGSRRPVPPLLAGYPGLDGGEQGHWGNQDEATWRSDAWNSTDLGSLQCGVFRGAGVTVARGVCVRLGDEGELAACFNPDTLTYDAVWAGGFVRFSPVRHGFVDGLQMVGEAQPRPAGHRPAQPFRYLGFHRNGPRVLFRYRIGDAEYLDAPWVKDGRFDRTVAPAATHPLAGLLRDPPAQWSTPITTEITHGAGSPWAIDTIGLPVDNPWKALPFLGGHGFLPDGSALVCTMQGDVWRVSGVSHPSKRAVWHRFAAGLHQALGMVVDGDGVFVLGRDQITRLHDTNGDGEADHYECFSNAFATSAAGHDFVCGLERDAAGDFYTASGNQGLVRISKDGRQATVLATGFRNPDGLGLLPDGTVTVPCSEGTWTPASMICAVRPTSGPAPYFGFGGPRGGKPPALPFAYLPRGIDNSSGGQVAVPGDAWGPLAGQLLHLSFGNGTLFLVLRDEVQGQLQGAVVPLPGEFRSGAHRGRFHPKDGQLYVGGMAGWGTYTPEEGCLQRVRHTGAPVQLPVGFRVHENGVRLTFSAPLDAAVAGAARSHFAQVWNYRYSGAYGSPEWSSRHPDVRGHDVLAVTAAHVGADGRSLFLEIPALQPVNQLHLRVRSAAGAAHELFVTAHRLAAPFEDFPGYRAGPKTIAPHPILADLARVTRTAANPARTKLDGARAVTIAAASNLTFATRSFEVRAGEVIALTLSNPDVVPHNLVVIRPGSLRRVGQLANGLIADPDAALRHYVPESEDVLWYTDVVQPRGSCTIWFRAPSRTGRYPYLCTFPGHWPVMNGTMVVE